MYCLNWNHREWGKSSIQQRVDFDTLDKLKEVMSKCIYNGEWVTDSKGNEIEMDWENICMK